MRLWVEGKAYSPEKITTILNLASDLEWLFPVVEFLRFWFSDEPEFTTKTSGSTGIPKTIQISRENLVISAKSTLGFFQLDPATDGLVLCIPAKHVGGFMNLARGILGNLDVWILEPKSDPIPASDPLLNQLNWFISLVPLQLKKIATSKKLCEASRNWKGILVGGADLSTPQIESVKNLHCPVYQSYGMTETVSHVAIRKLTDKKDSPYQALPGVKFRINEEDCLEINSEITGYKWLTTNDLVGLVSDSGFRFLGRKDDIINSGGIKIDPQTISGLISGFLGDPKTEFLVLGIPDEKLGQKAVVAFVSNPESPQPDWARLTRFLRSKLDSKLVPKLYFKIEKIPVLPNLKTDKLLLIRLLKKSAPVWNTSKSI